MNKEQSIQQMEFTKLDIYLQKYVFRAISLTSIKVNSKQAKYLKIQSVEQLEEKSPEKTFQDTGKDKNFLHRTPII